MQKRDVLEALKEEKKLKQTHKESCPGERFAIQTEGSIEYQKDETKRTGEIKAENTKKAFTEDTYLSIEEQSMKGKKELKEHTKISLYKSALIFIVGGVWEAL